MKFQLLNATRCSLTFELFNDEIYKVSEPFVVFVNGKEALKTDHNVFTLFSLSDDTEYDVSIGEDHLTCKTLRASYILHLKDFSCSDEDQTLMIQTAINMTPRDGVLVVDKGVYHTKSLYLHSHMTLCFEEGAEFSFSNRIEDYPLMPKEIMSLHGEKPLQMQPWEGNPFPSRASMLNVIECEDVTIVGKGIINGNAGYDNFWHDVKKLTWGRPRLLFIERSNGFVTAGMTYTNTPCWTIHPYFSNHLGFYDIDIKNPKDAPNTDGMDPESCDYVDVIGVRFSVGDDCVALKSGKIYIGSTYKVPANHSVIRNCFMNEGHGAVVLGSEIGAGVKNLTVERCLFHHTDRGLRIKSRRGRGQDSVLDNIVFRDIKMDNVLTPLTINMFYFCDPDGKSFLVQDKNPHKVDETTPYIGNFLFERIHSTDAEVALGFFYGLPEQPIASITVKDSTFTVKADAKEGMPAMLCDVEKMKKRGFVFHHVKNVVLDNVTATGYEGELVEQNDVGNLEIK